jgi:hypothetical protein
LSPSTKFNYTYYNDKIEKLKIHKDEINKIVNIKNIIYNKIQLWTNDKGNEYAISLLFDSDEI